MTARQRILLEPGKTRQLDDLLNSLLFDEAMDAALLEYLNELGRAEHIEDAAARNWKREGAVRVLAVLKGIAKPPQPAPEPITSQLLKQ